MAFEVFSSRGGRRGIPRGRVSVSADGVARCNAADLAAVGVEGVATILIDPERRSLAIRGLLEGEQGVLVGKGADDARCKRIWLGGALRAIGVLPADQRGWRDCAVVDGRLEIQLRAPSRRRRVEV